MKNRFNLDCIYQPSEDIVVRDIQGELIIIPITSGIVDTEDEIFTLNETGRAIWEKLDGKRTLREIIHELEEEFEGAPEEIENDVLGIIQELLKRRILVEVKGN